MRYFAIPILLCLSQLVIQGLATAERGSTERILYYSSYLAEGYLGVAPTIAPGCRGVHGRCSFDEFLSYVWEQSPNERTGRPTVSIFEGRPRHPNATPFKFTDQIARNLNDMIGRINGFKGGTINGNIDVERLMPGVGDFYDCLARAGNPITQGAEYLEANREQRESDRQAAAKADADAEKIGGQEHEDQASRDARTARDARIKAYDELTKIVPFGKDTARVNYELRLKDMEIVKGKGDKISGGKRLSTLAEFLGLEQDQISEKGPNTANVAKSYDVFSSEKALAFRTEEQLDDALRRFAAIKGVSEHMKALESAKQALRGAGC